jgi:type III restriction enzyme
LEDGRRPAGYVKATEHSKAFDDPGLFVELLPVKRIRSRVKAWREEGLYVTRFYFFVGG